MDGRFTRLEPVLEEARAIGLLGPEPVGRHVRHGVVLGGRVDPPISFLDLGAGAGIPGLVLALLWPESRATLLDASERRTAFCLRAAAELGLEDRVRVVRARAEVAGHEDELRERFDLVTARSFARPAVTAECGGSFLRPGGRLLVSEPPDVASAEERWPAAGLAGLGLGPAAAESAEGVSSVSMEKVGPTPERIPRRTGIPGKRPLWS